MYSPIDVQSNILAAVAHFTSNITMWPWPLTSWLFLAQLADAMNQIWTKLWWW